MKKILALFTLAAVMLLAGCNKFLDTLPDNRTEIDTVDKVTQLLANAYPKASYHLMLEPRCDGYKDFGSDYFGMQPEGMEMITTSFNWSEYDYEYNWDSHEFFWEQSYLAIAYSNFALQAIEEHGMTGRQTDLNRAEARISRAYNHFTLLSMFSDMFAANKASMPGIPYVEEPEDEIFKQYDRETVEKTLAKIEKDLFEEIDNIGGVADYDQPKFHFTTNSANAFATRFKLFTGDYAGVIQYANRILPVPSKFYTDGQNTETDGSDKVYVDPTDLAYLTIGNAMSDWVEYDQYGTNVDAAGRAFTNPAVTGNYLASEPMSRSMRGFLGTYYTRYGYPSQTVSDMARSNVTGGIYALSILELTGVPCGFWVKHYEDFQVVNPTAGTGRIYNKNILFRIEEVLLNRAEAYAMTGRYQEAVNDLNMYIQKKISEFDPATHNLSIDKIHSFYVSRVRDDNNFLNQTYNSAKLVDRTLIEGEIQRALLLAILDMRRIEFLYEGNRYFDLLRWRMPISHSSHDGRRITLPVDDPRRILQVPEGTAVSGMEPNNLGTPLQLGRIQPYLVKYSEPLPGLLE